MSRPHGCLRFKILFCLVLACLLAAPPLQARTSRSSRSRSSSSRAAATPATFDSWTAAASSGEARLGESWTAVIEDLSTTETIFAYRADRRLVPASNRKIITFGMALDALGPDYQFQTEFGLSAPCEPGREIFHGDVILRSIGDPSLTDPFLSSSRNPAEIFRTWARTLKDSGIRSIYGNVVIDASAFGESQNDYPEETWGSNHKNQTYAPIPAALSMCQNLMRITITPSSKIGGAGRISIFPADEGIRVINNTRTSSRGSGGVTAVFDEQSKALALSGSVRSGRTEVATIPIPHPLHYIGQLLHASIKDEGISVTGSVDVRTSGSAAGPVLAQRMGAHESPPLAQMLYLMMRESNNFLAEQLWRAAAARVKGVGDLARARQAEIEWYRRNCLPSVEPGWDGSGLSRKTSVSARELAAITRGIYNTAYQSLFLTVLPTAGVSGTLRHRTSSLMDGRVTAKTGTLSGVSTLTGFIKDEQGRPRFVFSILGNASRDTNGRLAKRINDLLNIAIRQLDADIAAGRRPAVGPAPTPSPNGFQYAFSKSTLAAGSADFFGAEAERMGAERELPQTIAQDIESTTTMGMPLIENGIGQGR